MSTVSVTLTDSLRLLCEIGSSLVQYYEENVTAPVVLSSLRTVCDSYSTFSSDALRSLLSTPRPPDQLLPLLFDLYTKLYFQDLCRMVQQLEVVEAQQLFGLPVWPVTLMECGHLVEKKSLTYWSPGGKCPKGNHPLRSCEYVENGPLKLDCCRHRISSLEKLDGLLIEARRWLLCVELQNGTRKSRGDGKVGVGGGGSRHVTSTSFEELLGGRRALPFFQPRGRRTSSGRSGSSEVASGVSGSSSSSSSVGVGISVLSRSSSSSGSGAGAGSGSGSVSVSSSSSSSPSSPTPTKLPTTPVRDPDLLSRFEVVESVILKVHQFCIAIGEVFPSLRADGSASALSASASGSSSSSGSRPIVDSSSSTFPRIVSLVLRSVEEMVVALENLDVSRFGIPWKDRLQGIRVMLVRQYEAHQEYELAVPVLQRMLDATTDFASKMSLLKGLLACLEKLDRLSEATDTVLECARYCCRNPEGPLFADGLSVLETFAAKVAPAATPAAAGCSSTFVDAVIPVIEFLAQVHPHTDRSANLYDFLANDAILKERFDAAGKYLHASLGKTKSESVDLLIRRFELLRTCCGSLKDWGQFAYCCSALGDLYPSDVDRVSALEQGLKAAPDMMDIRVKLVAHFVKRCDPERVVELTRIQGEAHDAPLPSSETPLPEAVSEMIKIRTRALVQLAVRLKRALAVEQESVNNLRVQLEDRTQELDAARREIATRLAGEFSQAPVSALVDSPSSSDEIDVSDSSSRSSKSRNRPTRHTRTSSRRRDRDRSPETPTEAPTRRGYPSGSDTSGAESSSSSSRSSSKRSRRAKKTRSPPSPETRSRSSSRSSDRSSSSSVSSTSTARRVVGPVNRPQREAIKHAFDATEKAYYRRIPPMEYFERRVFCYGCPTGSSGPKAVEKLKEILIGQFGRVIHLNVMSQWVCVEFATQALARMALCSMDDETNPVVFGHEILLAPSNQVLPFTTRVRVENLPPSIVKTRDSCMAFLEKFLIDVDIVDVRVDPRKKCCTVNLADMANVDRALMQDLSTLSMAGSEGSESVSHVLCVYPTVAARFRRDLFTSVVSGLSPQVRNYHLKEHFEDCGVIVAIRCSNRNRSVVEIDFNSSHAAHRSKRKGGTTIITDTKIAVRLKTD